MSYIVEVLQSNTAEPVATCFSYIKYFCVGVPIKANFFDQSCYDTQDCVNHLYNELPSGSSIANLLSNKTIESSAICFSYIKYFCVGVPSKANWFDAFCSQNKDLILGIFAVDITIYTLWNIAESYLDSVINVPFSAREIIFYNTPRLMLWIREGWGEGPEGIRYCFEITFWWIGRFHFDYMSYLPTDIHPNLVMMDIFNHFPILETLFGLPRHMHFLIITNWNAWEWSANLLPLRYFMMTARVLVVELFPNLLL